MTAVVTNHARVTPSGRPSDQNDQGEQDDEERRGQLHRDCQPAAYSRARSHGLHARADQFQNAAVISVTNNIAMVST